MELRFTETGKKLEALLKDFCGQYRKEINLLVMVAREGITEEILTLKDSKLDEWQLRRLVNKFCDNTGVAENFALWAIRSWYEALCKESIAENDYESKTMSQEINNKPIEWNTELKKTF